MDKLQVFGQSDLKGSIDIPGAKNSVSVDAACSSESPEVSVCLPINHRDSSYGESPLVV